MISQHKFREWLGAVKQQIIALADIDQVLECLVASPDHNELTLHVRGPS